MVDIPKFARIDVRVLKAVSKFASKDETRYYLNGACLEIDDRGVSYIATDGARLIAYRSDMQLDYPNNGVKGTFIIPTDFCRLFKFKNGDPTDAVLFVEGLQLKIEFDGSGLIFSPIEGIFPDWRRVIPRDRAGKHVAQFDHDYLASFTQFASDLDLPLPAVAHDKVDTPAIVRFGNMAEVIGTIMPMRAEDPYRLDLPAWVVVGETES